jgi:hypothetical protein
MRADEADVDVSEDGQPAPDPQPLQRDKGGRPPFVPTRAQRLLVRTMAANRVPQEIMARNILRDRDDEDGISERTLRKVFRQELDEGYQDTVARMGMAVVKSGLSGNVAAAKYWLQTHGGDQWKTTKKVPHRLRLDTQAAIGSNPLVAPVLEIRPVRAIDLTKANGHQPPGCSAHAGELSDDAQARSRPIPQERRARLPRIIDRR